jgi:hypothetical protein
VAAVVDDAAALSRQLKGTPLEGRPFAPYRLWPSEERLLSVDIDPSELPDVWSAARALLDQTGRWPIAGTEDSALRAAAEVCDGSDSSSDGGAGRAIAGERAVAKIRARCAEAWGPVRVEDMLTYQLNRMRVGNGVSPTRAEVLAALPAEVSREELDRWLMDWEEGQQPTVGPEDARHLSWSVPPQSWHPQLEGWSIEMGFYGGRGTQRRPDRRGQQSACGRTAGPR